MKVSAAPRSFGTCFADRECDREREILTGDMAMKLNLVDKELIEEINAKEERRLAAEHHRMYHRWDDDIKIQEILLIATGIALGLLSAFFIF